jgi:ketosteroid isomerase-like protein
MPLSAADRIAISEVIARYCHATDAGDGPGVADQFTEDGILEITGSWQARGREQVAQIGAFPNKPKHWVSSIVIDGNGSTASATTYYAAIGHGGPLFATGIYESQLTKQLNGRWKLLHHRYTGDPVERPRPPRERPRDPKALGAEDRLVMMDMVARYSRAVADRDFVAAAALFFEDGVLDVDGQSPVQGRAAIERALAAVPAPAAGHEAREWATNFIIEGDVDAAQLRAYYCCIRGGEVVRTGKHLDTLSKRDGVFRFVRRQLSLDVKPK